jgi:hypothetical protein
LLFNKKLLDGAIDASIEREDIELGEKETRIARNRTYERRPYVWIGEDDI